MAIIKGYKCCATYRGYTISIRDGAYWSHDPEGFLTAFMPTRDRAAMRRNIDWKLDR